MSFRALPATACWRHREARSGFEVAYFRCLAGGWFIEGTTTAVEDSQTWVVTYRIELDSAGVTRRVQVAARTAAGSRETVLESDGEGRWLADGDRAGHLEGCMDADLESSAMTNALPVRRLRLPPGARARVPAAYVRVSGPIERLEQTYARITDEAGRQRYEYAAPAFGFTSVLVYGEDGLVLDYPGIATRAG